MCGIWVDNFEVNVDVIYCVIDEKCYCIWCVYLVGSVYGFECDWILLYQVICIKVGCSVQQLLWLCKYIYV